VFAVRIGVVFEGVLVPFVPSLLEQAAAKTKPKTPKPARTKNPITHEAITCSENQLKGLKNGG
jgi:hypothetical protein